MRAKKNGSLGSLTRPLVATLLACGLLPTRAAALTQSPIESGVVAAPLDGRTSASNRAGSSTAATRDPTLLLAGGIVGGTGLLLAAIGFGVFGGIHAGNPGKGFELSGFDDDARRRSILRLTRGMQVLGILGAAMTSAGIILVAIGAPRHASRRRNERALAIVPGAGSLSLVGRF